MARDDERETAIVVLLRAQEARRFVPDRRRDIFRNPKGDAQIEIELARSTEEEKQSQITRLRDFQKRNAATSGAMVERFKQTVIDNGNTKKGQAQIHRS